jgi:dTDP-4-amino-4,6-dideoxygalactose transaminase
VAFSKIKDFELALAEYTGAPYAVMTDCCTHAIELCLRIEKPKQVAFTSFTYLSVPMTMHKLGIKYDLYEQFWLGEYPIAGTRVWDSARRLEPNMYEKNTMKCLSFGHSKPLELGHGGAILLDDHNKYERLLRMRYDGRDLTVNPWVSQQTFEVGYHYRPTIEDAEKGLVMLDLYKQKSAEDTKPEFVQYPDCRQISINS